MRISKTTLIAVTIFLVFSIIVANVTNLLNTPSANEFSHYDLNKISNVSAESDHLLWFLQVTDIHISIFKDLFRISDFKEFCDITVNTINPSIVLASGDLTDAKTQDGIGSYQFEEEWQHYYNILNETVLKNNITWLDIRGNHDNFNVAGPSSSQNYFSKYSVQGKKHPRSYMYQVKDKNDLYSFIGIDACLEPGPRRPFNFIGMIDDVEVKELNHLIELAELSGSNYTIWFGHFPTSCIITPKDYVDVRHIIGKHNKSMAYLCGHLHQLGGLVKKMYTLQQVGFLELELGDWKDNRMYRLLAIDHGMLSFIDLKHHNWPVALITNPKNGLFLLPKENIEVIKASTHIRILAFSPSHISSVKVRINSENWNPCSHVSGPLYVKEWHPELYSSGVHYIQVQVQDLDGRELLFSQSFSLDGAHFAFDFFPRLILMSSASTIFKIFFALAIIVSVLPLCILRCLQTFNKEYKYEHTRTGNSTIWIRKLRALSTVDRMFWPLIIYPIYLTVGPWSVGYIVENHLGIIFAWGIFVNGTFLPGSFTYAYGFLQIITFQIPLICTLSSGFYERCQAHISKQNKKKTVLQWLFFYLPFVIVLSVQVVMAYLFWLAYGTIAVLLSPLRTWSIIMAVLLWKQTLSLPERNMREALHIFSDKSLQNISSDNSVSYRKSEIT